MKVSQKGLDLIAKFEGIRLVAYKCSAGVQTIGIGSTRYEDGSPVKAGDVLESEAAAYALFKNTIKQYEDGVNRLVTAKINQNQFDALVSFAYNLGTDEDADNIAEGLGDSTLLKLVNANPSNPAIRAQFMVWVNSGGKRTKGLVRRRNAEADLYFK
jgi:lysozyme